MARRIAFISFLVAASAIGIAFLAAAAAPVMGSGDAAGMVYVPGGTFLMGCSPGDLECDKDEKPARQIAVKGFWIDATPVTQAQHQAVVGKNPSLFKGCSDCPVEMVSWSDAQAFCAKVGKRLPTEAEWEYAARGGTTGPRYGDLHAIAWCKGNSGGKTHPVGQKQPNLYGLHDMLGNVWEWCADRYDGNRRAGAPAEVPMGPSSEPPRVLRGGSWITSPGNVRASSRDRADPANRTDFIGFRCARDRK